MDPKDRTAGARPNGPTLAGPAPAPGAAVTWPWRPKVARALLYAVAWYAGIFLAVSPGSARRRNADPEAPHVSIFEDRPNQTAAICLSVALAGLACSRH
jgi:hypothetical protein